MAGHDETKWRARPFQFALGTPTGQAAWREILEKSEREIRLVLSGRPDSAGLEDALKAVWDGRHLEGYLLGILVGYSTARLLLQNDDHANDIAQIVRRHPTWTTKQICKRLDVLGKEIPSGLQGKSPRSRLWEDAIKDRNSRFAKRVEKHISRIRIAIRRIGEAQKWKRFVGEGILP